MPLVSVIIPVYNVELYLTRCINSVLKQTYSNLQIIVINDGSTDSSLDILNKFEDKRLTVISKENGGLSSARNEGLKYAIGEYVTFIDSDDWIQKDMIEVMLKEANKTDSDIVTIFPQRVSSEKDIVQNKKVYQTEYYTYDHCISQLFLNKIPNYTWGKLYKTNIFTKYGIQFPEGKNYEDVATSYKIFSHCSSLTIIYAQMYYYYVRDNSIVHSKRLKEVYSMVEHIEEMNKFNIKNPFWGIYRLKLIYGIYMYALYLPINIKKTREYKTLTNKIKQLSHLIKTEKPLIFYLNTPNFYKAVVVKMNLVTFVAMLKQILLNK